MRLLQSLGLLLATLLPVMADDSLPAQLKSDVTHLAETIGERNMVRYAELQQAADWIDAELKKAGWRVTRQPYDIDGRAYENIIAEKLGTAKPEEMFIVGAHYDSVIGSAGANDNGTGVAAVLALARRLGESKPERTLRLVAFVNEEPFHFQSPLMGSWVYAKACKQRGENIIGMISLETIGYFSDEEGSQQYPAPQLGKIFPSKGNFIAFVGNTQSKELIAKSAAVFKGATDLPLEAAPLPEELPGVGWSDHWAFWQEGYSAFMVTDTAPFRYPHYHKATDTPDKVDYARFAQVVEGTEKIIRSFAGIGNSER